MKKSNLCGWAVIFTVTLLLAACASHAPKVATTDMTSGPDATITQPEGQKQMLERQQNELVIRQAWLDEREMRLNQRETSLDRRENALEINQAWLNERETRLAQGVPDLTRQREILAFKEAWLEDREDLVAQMEYRAASSTKLAGIDSTAVITETPRTRFEAGRCYAAVLYPAEYKTVAVTKPIEVPKGENLPVLYKTVTEKVKVTDEQMRWTEVLCDTDMSKCRVSEIQRALYRGGYNPGPIDGIVGRQTMTAVNAFQKDFNLTVADYLTVETVRALDANF